MSGLVSKVLAGGLSAGIFLLWWPAHVTTQGSEWLFIRGILWSLAFEVLLLAYKPLEQAITGAVRDRERRRITAVRPVRLARLLVLGAVGVVIPLVMLAGARPPAGTPARAAAPKVIVKREVVRREVVVRRVNHVVRLPGPAVTRPAPAATRTPAAAPRTTAAATPESAKRKPSAVSEVVAGSPKDAGTKTATTRPQTKATTTTPSPAATSTPVPSTTAATPGATARASSSATASTSRAATSAPAASAATRAAAGN